MGARLNGIVWTGTKNYIECTIDEVLNEDMRADQFMVVCNTIESFNLIAIPRHANARLWRLISD